MIILDEKDEVITCICGCKFIATQRDFRWWSNPREFLKFVECPKCSNPHIVMFDVHDGSEIVCVEEENKTTDNGNEKETENEDTEKTS